MGLAVFITDMCFNSAEYTYTEYTYHDNLRVDQRTAKQRCQALGRQLAMPKTKDQAELLLTNMPNYKTFGTFWIGAEYDRPFERIVWADGDVLWEKGEENALMYSHWKHGQPDSNATKSEGCVQMKPVSGNWSDVKCSNKRSYVCQRG